MALIVDIDKMARDYVDIWVEETVGPVEGCTFHYSASPCNDISWCEDGDHLSSIAVYQITCYVTFDELPDNEAIRITTGLLMSYIIDGDMEPLQRILDALWEQVTMIRLTGGAAFDLDMEKIAREVEG